MKWWENRMENLLWLIFAMKMNWLKWKSVRNKQKISSANYKNKNNRQKKSFQSRISWLENWKNTKSKTYSSWEESRKFSFNQEIIEILFER